MAQPAASTLTARSQRFKRGADHQYIQRWPLRQRHQCMLGIPTWALVGVLSRAPWPAQKAVKQQRRQILISVSLNNSPERPVSKQHWVTQLDDKYGEESLDSGPLRQPVAVLRLWWHHRHKFVRKQVLPLFTLQLRPDDTGSAADDEVVLLTGEHRNIASIDLLGGAGDRVLKLVEPDIPDPIMSILDIELAADNLEVDFEHGTDTNMSWLMPMTATIQSPECRRSRRDYRQRRR